MVVLPVTPSWIASQILDAHNVPDKNETALPVNWYKPNTSPSRPAGVKRETNVLLDA
jgi:hypothetical protein